MFYLTSRANADRNTGLTLPKSFIFDSEPAQIRDVVEIELGKEHLLISRETGGWCLLSETEFAFYRLLKDHRHQDFETKQETEQYRKECSAFTEQLWKRGLLTLPGFSSDGNMLQPDTMERPFRLSFMLSSGCNLACRYCYLGERKQGDAYSLSTSQAQAAIRLALQQGSRKVLIDFGEFNLAWNLVKRLVDFTEQEAAHFPAKEVSFLVQTNGTGLSPNRVRYLRDHRIFVGISLDGPQTIHDRYRIYRNGRGSYIQVRAGWRQVLHSGLPYIILATITRANWNQAAAVLDHFESLGIQTYAFKPVLRRGLADQGWDGIGITEGEYKQFLKEEFQYALDRQNMDYLDEIVVKFIFRSISDSRGWDNHCPTGYCSREKEVLFVNGSGVVYPCPRFGSNLDSAASLFQIEAGSALPDLSRAVSPAPPLPSACMKCAWKALCKGGCPLYHPSGDVSCSGYQEVYRYIFEVIFPALRAGRVLPSSKLGSFYIYENSFFEPAES